MQYKMLIGGQWHDAANGGRWSVINPATEEAHRGCALRRR